MSEADVTAGSRITTAAAETWRVTCLWARITWHWTIARTWRDLPGPWWCKLALLCACTAIPGPADEIALIAIARLCRTWRARRGRQGA